MADNQPYPFYPGPDDAGSDDLLQQIQQMRNRPTGQGHQLLAQLGLHLAQSLGDSLSARLTPDVYKQDQEMKRLRLTQAGEEARQEKQLKAAQALHMLMPPGEKARLDAEEQQRQFENTLHIAGGIANGTLQGAPAEGTQTPQLNPEASGAGPLMAQMQVAPAPKPALSAGGLNANPVPGATEKDQIEIDPSTFDPESDIGKAFKARGITSKFKIPASEAFKLVDMDAQKAGTKAEKEATQALLKQQVASAHQDIDHRFSPEYYKNLYGDKIDPEAEYQRKTFHEQLDAAMAHDSKTSNGNAVANVISQIRKPTAWEVSQEKAQARADQNAEVLSRQATTREAQTQQHVAQGWDARNKEIESAEKPIADWAARYGRLKESIDARTPIADALAIPELMTVMAGGMGSGLRMSESELNRISHGRSKWQDLIAAFNKWQLDPSKALSITDSQRGQISDLLSAMSKKMRNKINVITSTRDELADAKDVDSQHRIINKFHKGMLDLDFPAEEEKKARGGGAGAEPDFIVVNGKVVPNPKKGR